MTLSLIHSQEVISNELVDFGMRDEKGRAIGARRVISRVEYVAAGEGARSGYNRAPGVWYVVHVQPTRDGEKYGAIGAYDYLRDRDDAELVVNVMLQRTRGRYERKYRRGEG